MTNVKVEVISGRTFDTYPSILLRIQNKQYVFNVPVMFQKNLLGKHLKLKNIHSVFITSLFPDSVGGLSFYILQAYYQKKKIFQIIGPKEIPEVNLLDPSFVGEDTASKCNNPIYDSFSNDDINVKSIFLSKSISYEVFIKKQNQYILVVDCRSIDDLPKLPDLSKYLSIFHLTIPEILIKKEYIKFFTSHVISEENYNFCFMPSGIISNNISNLYYIKRSKDILQPLAFGGTLKPPDGFTNMTSENSSYDIVRKVFMISNQGRFIDINYDELENLNGLQILSHLIQFEPKLPKNDIYAVTILGTSTKFICPFRNNSGYLIHTKYGFVVLDPSEGFFEQIQRKFGSRVTEYILKNIECIWISHYHHDHCFGSPTLLYERSKITDKEIYFFAPQKFIESIQKISDHYGDFHVIYHNREDESNKADGIVSIPINDHICIHSIDVYHDLPFAKGCMLEIDGDVKIAFSGDRGYQKDNFANAFIDCNLLIHEATFPDREDKFNTKINDRHCTLSQAIETSNQMKSKFTVFTHLSQRYTEDELLCKIGNDKFIAFDFLEFSEDNIESVFSKL